MKKLIYSLMILMLLLPATAVMADDTHDVVIEENHACYPDGATNIKAYVTPYPTTSSSDFACCSRYYLRMYIDGQYIGWDEYHTNWWSWNNLEFSWSGTLTEGEHTIKAEWGIYNIYATNPFYPPMGSQEITIVIQPCITVIVSNVNFDPDTLNVKSNGNWITAYIELPEGYDVADIMIDTVILEGVIFAEEIPVNVGDNDEDGIPDLMVKFDRQALIEYLGERRGELTLMIHGELDEVTHFEGSDIINVN